MFAVFGSAGLTAFSGTLNAGFTAIAGAGEPNVMRPSARSVSRVDCVEKWNDRITFAGFTPVAAATAKCEAVKPQEPCIGAFGRAAQLAGFTAAPSVVLIVA